MISKQFGRIIKENAKLVLSIRRIVDLERSERILNSQYLPNIVEFKLEEKLVTDYDVKRNTADAIGLMENLEILSVSKCEIPLTFLDKLKKITILDLSNVKLGMNHFTDLNIAKVV